MGQIRMTLSERFDHFNLPRQMIGVIRRDTMQFINQFRRDLLRLGMRHAMHHSVSHGFDRSEGLLRFEPINQETRCRFVIGGGEAANGLRLSIRERITLAYFTARSFFTDVTPFTLRAISPALSTAC